MSYDVKNLAGLSYLEGGDLKSPDKIVLFHGYGADMFDLASLSEAVKTRKNFHWIFPNGTLEVPIGPHVSGRAWFPIDFEAFTRAMQSGQLAKRYPDGLESARTKAEKFLKALNLDWSRTYLGGFSQGSMLALELVCETDITPKGMLLLSSTLLNEDRWSGQMSLKKGMRYYQSHGEIDQVLPANVAVQLHEKMEASGWDGSLTLFRGGHEIPSKVIQEVASFLQ
jgi:phospholipase/carboxylesterase